MKTIRNLILICALETVMFVTTISQAQPVTKIAAGYQHSMFLKGDGSLWVMGYNIQRALGDGTSGFDVQTNFPELILTSDVIAVAAGGSHSLFLKSDGSLWAMGDNSSGQLGNGSYFSAKQPVNIVGSDVTAIAAGSGYSLFLKSDGSLWGMGDNGLGQLGDGSYNATNAPEQIVASNVTAIAAGFAHTLFLKRDGSLWAMGFNDSGQLGDGTYGSGNHTNLPEQIVASNVTEIAAASYHSMFLKSDGSLWVMGANDDGELGDGTYNSTNWPEQIVASNVTAIAAGGVHSLFLKKDGSLWAMGYNYDGELGDGTYSYNTNIPEQIIASDVTTIGAGFNYSMFVKSDGSLWVMGNNQYGKLGDGTYNNTNRPEQIVAGIAGYNRIFGELLETGDMRLSFLGSAGVKYDLECSFSLSPADWLPQATNFADTMGVLVFTNTPDPTKNNFWRICAVP
jgi:alpha-tubulin suppressor-like RCC1 family protein